MPIFVDTAGNNKLYPNEDNNTNESTSREDFVPKVSQAIFLGANKLYDVVLMLFFTIIAVVALLVSAIVAAFN